MQTVLNRADSIIDGVDGVNGLLDQTQTILDVDVNVTDISDDLSVSPSHALHCAAWHWDSTVHAWQWLCWLGSAFMT